MDISKLIRKERTESNGNKVIEVFAEERGDLQWELRGPWIEEDRELVETVLLENGPSYGNFWQLYDGTWGNMYRFVAKRYTWEYGPYCHGNTVTELARAIREYYEKLRRY